MRRRRPEDEILHAFRVPPWVAGIGRHQRAWWPLRALYWLRGYRSPR